VIHSAPGCSMKRKKDRIKEGRSRSVSVNNASSIHRLCIRISQACDGRSGSRRPGSLAVMNRAWDPIHDRIGGTSKTSPSNVRSIRFTGMAARPFGMPASGLRLAPLRIRMLDAHALSLNDINFRPKTFQAVHFHEVKASACTHDMGFRLRLYDQIPAPNHQAPGHGSNRDLETFWCFPPCTMASVPMHRPQQSSGDCLCSSTGLTIRLR